MHYNLKKEYIVNIYNISKDEWREAYERSFDLIKKARPHEYKKIKSLLKKIQNPSPSQKVGCSKFEDFIEGMNSSFERWSGENEEDFPREDYYIYHGEEGHISISGTPGQLKIEIESTNYFLHSYKHLTFYIRPVFKNLTTIKNKDNFMITRISKLTDFTDIDKMHYLKLEEKGVVLDRDDDRPVKLLIERKDLELEDEDDIELS